MCVLVGEILFLSGGKVVMVFFCCLYFDVLCLDMGLYGLFDSGC